MRFGWSFALQTTFYSNPFWHAVPDQSPEGNQREVTGKPREVIGKPKEDMGKTRKSQENPWKDLGRVMD